MEARQVVCPSCRARLRIREASPLTAPFGCPDCGVMLSLQHDAAGTLHCQLVQTTHISETQPPSQQTARREVQPSTAAAKPLTTSIPDARQGNERASEVVPSSMASRYSEPSFSERWWKRFTPMQIAWVVAGLMGVAVIVWVATGGESDHTNRAPSGIAANDGEGELPKGVNEEKPSPPTKGATDGAPELPLTPPDTGAPDVDALSSPAATKMQQIGELLKGYQERSGHFPVAPADAQRLPADRRLGWIADAVAHEQAQRPDGPQPLWDRPFDDPLNSPFVRQRQERFLNPLLNAAGAGGFPATNFVGVGGVGRDAPDLAIDHPRAGVFGYNRRTTLNDITDGASNTFLVMGVRDRFAPWSSGGAGTIRGLTETPYVNGPDGFGTGQPSSMFVLMADGSVRQISDRMDPLLLRRMAAMRDGLALDVTVPGEPGGTTPAPPAVANIPPVSRDPLAPAVQPGVDVPVRPEGMVDPKGADDRPIDVPIAPPSVDLPSREYDVQLALSQKLSRFSQSRPARIGDLLDQLEEMLGVPINRKAVTESPHSAILERTISFELRNATLAELLDAIVSRGELSYTTNPLQGVVLTPVTNPPR